MSGSMESRTPVNNPMMSRRDPTINELQLAHASSGSMLRYLERMAGNRATADDLLQETLTETYN